MNLSQFTQKLAQTERETMTAILHHLREIERRKLYSTLACSSLFDFCIRILGYSEGSAQRRISAMRLMRDLPEVEEKIASGELKLSVAAQAQTFFRQEAKVAEPLSREEKKEVIEALEGKTTRQAERELLSRSAQPELHKKERVRPVSQNLVELRIFVSPETQRNLERAKGQRAHSHPHLSTGELVDPLGTSCLPARWI